MTYCLVLFVTLTRFMTWGKTSIFFFLGGGSVVSSLKRGTKPTIATPKATVRSQESGK